MNPTALVFIACAILIMVWLGIDGLIKIGVFVTFGLPVAIAIIVGTCVAVAALRSR